MRTALENVGREEGGSQGGYGFEPSERVGQSLGQNMEAAGVGRVKLAVFVQTLPGDGSRSS